MSFPHVIDNTIRKAIATCHTKAKRLHIDNLRPVGEDSVDLHFGRCFASAMEVIRKSAYVQGNDPYIAMGEGIEAAVKEWGTFQLPSSSKSCKTLDRLVHAIRFYFTVWPLGEDGLTPVENGIECMFDFELPILHPDTAEPLRYAGRYDMLASDKSKLLYVVDEKTTGKMGNSWISQWDLDTQMSGYIWSVKRERPDALVMAQVRGISILQNDFGHAEIPIIRPQWMLDMWYGQMLRDVMKFKQAYLTDTFDKALHSNACSQYNRDCEFKQLCLSPNPERLIDGNYKEVIWNPLERKA